MGNEQCNECKDTTIETHAYGSHEVLHEATTIYAIVEKRVEKDPRLQKAVTKQL